MDESDFEGSLILEKLTTLGLYDEFFKAIDSDNLDEVTLILEDAGIDEEAIDFVLKKMST